MKIILGVVGVLALIAVNIKMTNAYNKVTEGSTCRRITLASECTMAAQHLGLDTWVSTAREETESNYPPGCYFQPGASGVNLWFNKDSNSDMKCTSDNVCLCKGGHLLK